MSLDFDQFGEADSSDSGWPYRRIWTAASRPFSMYASLRVPSLRVPSLRVPSLRGRTHAAHTLLACCAMVPSLDTRDSLPW